MLKKKITKEDIASMVKVLPNQMKEQERQEIIDSIFIKLKEFVNSRIDELTLVIDKLDPDKSLDLIANQVQSKFAYTDLALYLEVLHTQFVERMTFDRLHNAFNVFYDGLVSSEDATNVESQDDMTNDVSSTEAETLEPNN